MENQANKAALLEQVRETSTLPGIYMMKDDAGTVIYVGKAKNLRSRLAQYFQPATHENPRTEMMVGRVRRFDVILTETEAEALLLECTLIKKHKPKFNVRLKDDKSYPYLKIQVLDEFPRIEYTRRTTADGSRYFGPFPSAWSARQVMDLLNDTFLLRDCSDNTFRHRSRPCILYQMGKCSGPCVGLIDRPGYRESIDQVTAILEGKTDRIVGELRRGMEDAAESENYELAAHYRDQMRNLELVTQTQGAVEAGSTRDRDVVGLARKDAHAHGTLLRIRGGRIVAIQHYKLQNTDPTVTEADLLFDFLSQFYAQAEKSAGEGEPAVALPSDVLVPSAPSDVDLLEQALGIGIRVAAATANLSSDQLPSGSSNGSSQESVDVQLLNVARTNAEYALEQNLKKTAVGHGLQALEDIMEKLHLAKLPSRIECFDISNTQGQDSVASRVVFVDGAPDKNLYRRYKIKTVEGSNDFASMKEVLGRRFAHDESLPDLVVVDGGKGQLSQAVAILDELGVQGVAVVGLAKARTESDFQSSEVKSSNERIFIPNRKNPVALLPHMSAYKLLVHIRDEAHRFAITYHRNLRSKRTLKPKR